MANNRHGSSVRSNVVAEGEALGYSHVNHLGVVVSRWMPRSSKPVTGRAERAVVGSTPIHSRLKIPVRLVPGALPMRDQELLHLRIRDRHPQEDREPDA